MSAAISTRSNNQDRTAPYSAVSDGTNGSLTIDDAIQRIDAEGRWDEIFMANGSTSRTGKPSPFLSDICQAIGWTKNKRISIRWFWSVTLVMWLSIPFDFIVVPHALPSIIIGHGCLTTMALLLALGALRHREWANWQGITACLFVSVIMLAAILTGRQAGGADFERFVVIAFFGMATGVAFLPLSTRWTALTALTLNVIFLMCQFVNPAVEGASGLLFTLYLSAVSSALVWSRWYTNYRQFRATLSRLKEARTSSLLKESHDRLHTMAYTDALTGLRNRMAMSEDFTRLLQTAPVGEALSVAMIDVDDFKRLNDSLGHAAGDQALRSLGSLLQKHSKLNQAVCGRIGGEEFLLVMPGATMDVARRRIGGLMDELRHMNLRNAGSRVSDRVTVSVGIVTMIMEDGEERNPESLMRQADFALYEAKNGGRNRIVSVMNSVAPSSSATIFATTTVSDCGSPCFDSGQSGAHQTHADLEAIV